MKIWVAGLLLLLSIAHTRAMTFRVEVIDLRPIENSSYFVYGSGAIVAGDAGRLAQVLQAKNRQSNQRVHVILHSPGGSLVEGIRLGRTISELNATTDVRMKSSDNSKSQPGECLSACVLAYIGGTYRYLQKDSKIGIHQFAFSKEQSIESNTAVAITQFLSAELVEFIKQNRVDTDFFSLMTRVPSTSIYFVPHKTLRELRVVTDNVWDEQWSFELLEGKAYLRIWQQSYHGENKLVVYCDNKNLVGGLFVQPPENNSVGRFVHSVGVFVDGDLVAIPDQMILRQPMIEDKFANAMFLISPELANRMMGASSTGGALQPPNKGIFLGFKTVRNKDRDKLSKLILGCR